MDNKIKQSSGIEYSGKISLKLKIGDKTYKFKRHNEGLSGLFKLLCYAITNQSLSGLVPVAIDIRNAEGTTSRLAKAVPISSLTSFKDEGVYYGVRIVALLQTSNIASPLDIVDGDCLYLMSDKDKLAKIEYLLTHFKTSECFT